jgi:hypothetical protein
MSGAFRIAPPDIYADKALAKHADRLEERESALMSSPKTGMAFGLTDQQRASIGQSIDFGSLRAKRRI